MASGEGGSVTFWIGDLKSGGHQGAQHLWERYFDRLTRLARKRLQSRRLGAAEDAEDAALSAFDSFCRGAEQGRFPRLSNRDDLWRILVFLTIRKALDQLERQGAAKRGAGKRIDIDGAAFSEASGRPELRLDQIVGNEPSPELAAMVADEYRRLRDELGDDSLREVLDLRLEGHSREEIAERLGCAQRTVTRKLDVIRQTWVGEEDA
jgi:DNA-directed RNA polymerase specialized sigma24 family protein